MLLTDHSFTLEQASVSTLWKRMLLRRKGSNLAYSKSSASATSISSDSSPMEALGTLLPRSPTRPTSDRRRTTHRPALPEADVLAESMAPEPWLVPVLALAVVQESASEKSTSVLH